jgi:hypothetical protein
VLDEVMLEQGVGVPVQLLDDQVQRISLSQAAEDARVEQETGVPVHKPVLEL